MNKQFVTRLARYSAWMLAGLLALVPFQALLFAWPGSNFGHTDVFRSWEELVLLVLTPGALWLAWREPKLRNYLLSSWLFRLSLAYIALHLVLGAWAYSAHHVNLSALLYSFIVNLRLVAIFYICLVISCYDDLLKRLWRYILFVPAGVAIVFGLAQEFLLPPRFLEHFGYSKYTVLPFQYVDANQNFLRVQSTLRGANPFGAYLVLIISAAVVSLKGRNLKPLYLLAGLVAMFYTYSRSAWIGLLLALGFIAWLSMRQFGSRLVYISLAGVIIFVAGLYMFRDRQSLQDALLHTSNNSHSAISSNAARSSALKQGLHDMVHQPLGRGPGTAGPASVRNNHPARIAENYYIQIAQEVGIVGLIIFVAINLMVVWQLWQRRSQELPLILLASCIGISFINMLSHAWTDDTLALLWWGLAGVACAPAILKANKTKTNAEQTT